MRDVLILIPSNAFDRARVVTLDGFEIRCHGFTLQLFGGEAKAFLWWGDGAKPEEVNPFVYPLPEGRRLYEILQPVAGSGHCIDCPRYRWLCGD